MEEYLKQHQQHHAENYMGTDDDIPDNFDAWLVNLDVDEWIKLSEWYAQSDYVPAKEEDLPF